MRPSCWRIACLLIIALWGSAAAAQTYPAKPIRMIVTFAAGGSSDAMARAVAKSMSENLGQQIVIDNRPGAGGNIGAEFVARSAPDGYTVLFGTNGTMSIGPALYKNLTYDPVHDLVPVGMLHTLPNVLVVHKSIPADNLKELIAYARAHPGEVSFASAGNGTASHLSGELFKMFTGLDIVHVPYRGGGGSVTADLMAGRVSMMIETVTNALTLANSGEMRALAVTTPKRSSAAPDLPTFAEAGLPGYEVTSWTGLFVPFGTPRLLVMRLNTETKRIVKDPAYLAQMKQIGTDVVTSTPEEFGAFMKADIARWTDTIKRSGAQVE
jgi:tripartite-type tricarboxylate transporter receptor subunit TctC